MNSKKNMELIKHFNERKDFKVYFDGENPEIFKYDEEKNRYQSFWGYITLEVMVRAIEDENYWIKLEII